MKKNNKIKEINKDKTETFDKRYIKAYIGDKADVMYDSIKNGGVNIWALLFGIFYFAYRKMYLISIIIIILSGITSILAPSIDSYIGTIIGLMFCPLYKWDITRKLRKIKKNNLNVTEEELISLAKNKGGTSIASAIIFLISFILIVVFI